MNGVLRTAPTGAACAVGAGSSHVGFILSHTTTSLQITQNIYFLVRTAGAFWVF